MDTFEQELNECVKAAFEKLNSQIIPYLEIKTNIPLSPKEILDINHQALNKLGEILNRKRWLR